MLKQLLENCKQHLLTLFAFLDRKDKRGVRTITIAGNLEEGKPSSSLCQSSLWTGLLMVPPGIAGLAYVYLAERRIHWIVLMFVIWGSCFLANSWFMRRLRHQLASLSPFDALSSRLGIGAEALQRRIGEQDIQPRYSINGQDYYDPADLGDVATLLRASAAPVKQEELLRAAAHTETSPDTLLRAAKGARNQASSSR